VDIVGHEARFDEGGGAEHNRRPAAPQAAVPDMRVSEREGGENGLCVRVCVCVCVCNMAAYRGSKWRPRTLSNTISTPSEPGESCCTLRCSSAPNCSTVVLR
jgi:hypothetical protein